MHPLDWKESGFVYAQEHLADEEEEDGGQTRMAQNLDA